MVAGRLKSTLGFAPCTDQAGFSALALPRASALAIPVWGAACPWPCSLDQAESLYSDVRLPFIPGKRLCVTALTGRQLPHAALSPSHFANFSSVYVRAGFLSAWTPSLVVQELRFGFLFSPPVSPEHL